MALRLKYFPGIFIYVNTMMILEKNKEILYDFADIISIKLYIVRNEYSITFTLKNGINKTINYQGIEDKSNLHEDYSILMKAYEKSMSTYACFFSINLLTNALSRRALFRRALFRRALFKYQHLAKSLHVYKRIIGVIDHNFLKTYACE